MTLDTMCRPLLIIIVIVNLKWSVKGDVIYSENS